MLWMCLLYKLTRKAFWFQSNSILFFVHQKIRQDYGLPIDYRGPAVPSSPTHSLEGLRGKEINLGEVSAQGSRHREHPIWDSQLLCVPARLCLRAALQAWSFQVSVVFWATHTGNMAPEIYSCGCGRS